MDAYSADYTGVDIINVTQKYVSQDNVNRSFFFYDWHNKDSAITENTVALWKVTLKPEENANDRSN